ncbi:hypothetical protein LCGC14_2036000 [marine sediment metagenome]|uniref:Uncharacterized protein n=1 Tax=marine sediment metagenome TaxID=412755 RepID=A0A0F9H6S0_9ZZZZ
MEQNWKLLSHNYRRSLIRIMLATKCDADHLRRVAGEELKAASLRVKNGGYLQKRA